MASKMSTLTVYLNNISDNIAPQVKMQDSDWCTAGEHSICRPPLRQCSPARMWPSIRIYFGSKII